MKQKCQEALRKTTDLVEQLRLKCLARGAHGIKGLGREFRLMDDDRSNNLDYDEFKRGIIQFGLNFDEKELKELFQKFDKDGSGKIGFDEFLQELRPPLGKSRKDLILAAFKKFDRNGDGVVTVADMRGVYNVRFHPKYMNGEWTEEQVFKEFLSNFDTHDHPDNEVTQEEFMNYYCGVSASIDNDAYFDLMMRNAWKL